MKYLKLVFEVNRIISGVSMGQIVYKRLLNWNKSVPLIGFMSDRTTYAITLLKEKDKDGRTIDIICLESNKYHGTFRILSKNLKEYLKGEQEITLDCMWISGEDAGKVFKVERFFPFNLDPVDSLINVTQ